MTTQTDVNQASATPELINYPMELLDGSVADVEKALPTAANLDELLAAEVAGKARKGVASAIEAELLKRLDAEATANDDEPVSAPVAEQKFPCLAIVKKYDDRTPVQVKNAEHLSNLVQTHGKENVEVQS